MSEITDPPTNLADERPIAAPDSFSVSQQGADLLIERKWSRYEGIKNLAAGIFALVVTVGAANATGAQQAFSSGSLSFRDGLALAIFLGIFLALGVFFLITGIYSIINSTTIRVSPAALGVSHHPLPWRDKTLPVGDIRQVFITNHIKGAFGDKPLGATGDERYVYSVEVLMADGKKQALVAQLPKPQQARFVEQQIEKHLHIQDARVKGEY